MFHDMRERPLLFNEFYIADIDSSKIDKSCVYEMIADGKSTDEHKILCNGKQRHFGADFFFLVRVGICKWIYKKDA